MRIGGNGHGIKEEELDSPSAPGHAATRERMRAYDGRLTVPRGYEGGLKLSRQLCGWPTRSRMTRPYEAARSEDDMTDSRIARWQ